MVVVAAMSVVVIAVVIAVRHGERPPHAGAHCRVTWIGGGRPPVQLDGFSRAFQLHQEIAHADKWKDALWMR